jgi:hypothetical protein
MASSGLKTKRAVIEQALQLLVRLKAQEGVRSLRGQMQWEGDLDALRESRHPNDRDFDPFETYLGLSIVRPM